MAPLQQHQSAQPLNGTAGHATRAEHTEKQRMLAEGLRIAQEMLAGVRGAVQGVQVSAPFGKYAAAAEVLDALVVAGGGGRTDAKL